MASKRPFVEVKRKSKRVLPTVNAERSESTGSQTKSVTFNAKTIEMSIGGSQRLRKLTTRVPLSHVNQLSNDDSHFRVEVSERDYQLNEESVMNSHLTILDDNANSSVDFIIKCKDQDSQDKENIPIVSYGTLKTSSCSSKHHDLELFIFDPASVIEMQTPPWRHNIDCEKGTPDCYNTMHMDKQQYEPSYLDMGSQDDDEEPNSSVTVAVRVRPFSQRELADKTVRRVVSMCRNETTVTAENGTVHRFAYDFSFWSFDLENGDFAGQELVHSTLAKPLLNRAFEGYNTCLLAYGQTGSGKSYSIMGHDNEKGIIPRFCEDMFCRVQADRDINQVPIRVEISFFEIYNEKIHDLLGSSKGKSGKKPPLKVRDHPVLGPYVEGLSTFVVSSFEDVKGWITLGNKNRATAATTMNDESSRSHSVFTIVLAQTKNEEWEGHGHNDSLTSKINLVDLAGSERQSQTMTSRDRLREGASINKSLLTLGKVISLLSEDSAQNGRNKKVHIPYRDSVLTWLLKESLGGNSKTTMIATISPANSHIEETLSTLRYAKQAQSIVNVARVNEDPKAKLIRELRAEIEHLRLQLGNMNSEEAQTGTFAETASLREQLKDMEKEKEEMTRTWQERLKRSEDRNLEGYTLLEVTQLQHQIEKYKQQAVEYVILTQRSNHQKEECSALRSERRLLKQKISDLEKVNAEKHSAIKMQRKDSQSTTDEKFRNLYISMKAEEVGVKVQERKSMEDEESLKHTFEKKYLEFNNLSCEKHTSEKEELEKCPNHINQEKQDLLKKFDHSNNYIEDLNFSLEEKQQHEYSELQAEFQKYKNDANVKSMEKTQTKVILTQQMEALKNIIDGNDEIIGQLNIEITHKRDAIEKPPSLFDETRSELEESKMTSKHVQSDLDAEISQQVKENKSQQSKINCLQRDKECLNKQLEETQEKYNSVCQTLKECEYSCGKLASEKKKLEKCLNHKDQEKQDLCKTLDHLNNDLVTLKTEKAELEQSLSQALFRLKTAFTNLTAVSEQHEEAEQKYKFLNKIKVRAEKTEHECQVAKLERNVEDLYVSLEESKIHQEKQQHDYSELQAEFQKYKDDANVKYLEETQRKSILIQEGEELKNIIDGKDEIIGQLNNEITHIKDDAEKKNIMLKTLRGKLTDIKASFKLFERDSAARKLELEEQIVNQKNEIKVLPEKCNNLLTKLESLSHLKEDIQDKFKEKSVKLKNSIFAQEQLTANNELRMLEHEVSAGRKCSQLDVEAAQKVALETAMERSRILEYLEAERQIAEHKLEELNQSHNERMTSATRKPMVVEIPVVEKDLYKIAHQLREANRIREYY